MTIQKETPETLPFADIAKVEIAAENELLTLTPAAADVSDFAGEPEPEKPKRTRNRKPKTIPTPPPFVSDENLFTSAPAEAANAPEIGDGTKVALSDLIAGKTLVNSFDKIMGVLVCLGVNNFTDYKLKPSEMAATPDEKKILEPAISGLAKKLKLDFSNPWIAVTVCVVAVYGSKVAERINFTDEMFEEKPKRVRKPKTVNNE